MAKRAERCHSRRVGWKFVAGAGALAVALLASAAPATVTFGQLDDFAAGNTLGWSQGFASPSPTTVVTSGGPNGANDAYLRNVASGGFGSGGKQVMFNHDQWTGDYVTAGVTRLEMKLANFGTTDLAIRLTFTGGRGTRYSSTDAVALSAGSGWTSATFRLSPATMTSLSGTDTLSQVLSSVSELRILSASAPAFNGDSLASVLGVDAIRATRLGGDATFDGLVDFDDLVKLAQNYNRTTGVAWTDGDFTFDGRVDFDDLVILAQNYNTGGAVNAGGTDAGGVGGSPFGSDFSSDWALANSLVPEPGLVTAATGGVAVAGCRRRRVRRSSR